MSLVAAAVVPSAPLLVPALAGDSAAADARLRDATLAAVRRILAVGTGDLVVVGLAPETGEQVGTWDWSGFGVPQRGSVGGPSLPLALAIGGWLLDTLEPGVPRRYLGVADAELPEACAALGTALVSEPVRLLVVGDGSARRSEKAPGHLDPRAAPYDALVEIALFAGDPAALLALDAPLATELMVAGRAPWQVLAGAARGTHPAAETSYVDAPHGVGYVVATWTGT